MLDKRSKNLYVLLKLVLVICLAHSVQGSSAVTITSDDIFHLQLLNSLRHRYNLPYLCISMKLMNAATAQINYLYANQVTALADKHTASDDIGRKPRDRVERFGFSRRASGENWNPYDEIFNENVRKAVKSLWNSAGHRKNMVFQKYTHVGFGFIKDTQYGGYVEVFAQESSEGAEPCDYSFDGTLVDVEDFLDYPDAGTRSSTSTETATSADNSNSVSVANTSPQISTPPPPPPVAPKARRRVLHAVQPTKITHQPPAKAPKIDEDSSPTPSSTRASTHVEKPRPLPGNLKAYLMSSHDDQEASVPTLSPSPSPEPPRPKALPIPRAIKPVAQYKLSDEPPKTNKTIYQYGNPVQPETRTPSNIPDVQALNETETHANQPVKTVQYCRPK